MEKETKIQRCQAEVEHRDTYRYSGRGSSGFSMHYNIEQCSFKAKGERTHEWRGHMHLCSRHLALFDRNRYVAKCRWDSPWEPRTKDSYLS